ncbi:helix-turn-helix transcriptional regulator [Caldifermentibacillus hisashii]|uniref:helix-turn-helix domain-containing protein n=1 Tax=Caldifermentibacillus hisashii TaxID=996558 RepID=UPI0030E9195E
MEILGKRLKQLREQKKKENSKFTQGYVADLIGVARTTYTAYENGTKTPPPETINKIADLFDVTTDYLQGRTNNPKQPNNKLPELTAKDKKDIAKQLERILEAMDSDTGLAFDGEPMDEETKELVKTAIKSNLELTKQLAKQKFTPKKYRKDKE